MALAKVLWGTESLTRRCASAAASDAQSSLLTTWPDTLSSRMHFSASDTLYSAPSRDCTIPADMFHTCPCACARGVPAPTGPTAPAPTAPTAPAPTGPTAPAPTAPRLTSFLSRLQVASLVMWTRRVRLAAALTLRQMRRQTNGPHVKNATKAMALAMALVQVTPALRHCGCLRRWYM